jgi:hypothetical protein
MGKPDKEMMVVGEVDMSGVDNRVKPRKQSKDATLKPDERRIFERLALDKASIITELDEFGNPGASWSCRIVDLSRGGLGLRSRRMVHQGRCLFIRIDLGKNRPAKLLFGVVKQSRYSEGEGYAVGLEFRTVPETPSVKAWMAQNGLSASPPLAGEP